VVVLLTSINIFAAPPAVLDEPSKRQTLTDAYEANGDKNPKWDKPARAAIEYFVFESPTIN